jgi:hypothetical protein
VSTGQSALARKVWQEIGKQRERALRAVINLERVPPVVADPGWSRRSAPAGRVRASAWPPAHAS